MYCNDYGISVFATHIYYNSFSFSLKGNFRQSWTKVLTHLSKTNAFYTRPCVNSKNIFFTYCLNPLSPFSMLKDASLALPRGYNIENGRGGRKVKIWDWKTHAFNERGLFWGVSQLLLSMIVWITFYNFTQYEAFRASLLFRLLSST